MTETTPSLELKEIRKSYDGFVAVAGLSLTLEPGTVFGLLGPNGAGKTTSLRMIMDIIAPDSGEVLFEGHPRTRDDLERVGYLPEERGLYRRMTVKEHLVFLGAIHGLRRRDSSAKIDRWLERVGLSGWSGRKVEELSKGMQQKVQLVGTLLHDPDLIILDEPFSGLDPINQGLFKELLAEYKTAGKTILFSTHIMEQAEKLCDEICLISGGRPILMGNLAEIKRSMGGNSYRIAFDGEPDGLQEIEGIEQCVVQDGTAKILLDPEADPPEVLRRIAAKLPVREFRSAEPDLEEIFVRAVTESEQP